MDHRSELRQEDSWSASRGRCVVEVPQTTGGACSVVRKEISSLVMGEESKNNVPLETEVLMAEVTNSIRDSANPKVNGNQMADLQIFGPNINPDKGKRIGEDLEGLSRPSPLLQEYQVGNASDKVKGPVIKNNILPFGLKPSVLGMVSGSDHGTVCKGGVKNWVRIIRPNRFGEIDSNTAVTGGKRKGTERKDGIVQHRKKAKFEGVVGEGVDDGCLESESKLRHLNSRKPRSAETTDQSWQSLDQISWLEKSWFGKMMKSPRKESGLAAALHVNGGMKATRFERFSVA
ncbi:hypothetical protein LWI29_033790 [Acer saccharum]|uniref:Uncharacterized protein n=1 Tax=Acer saccharum TaxID=4024 RepID=A0AA39VSH1_ACESA|nr:hypothetical protein LWI29_033790 [Acer saccharum]